MVVIMPRSHPAGGMVDHKQTVEKPWTKANRIFNMPNNQESRIADSTNWGVRFLGVQQQKAYYFGVYIMGAQQTT